LTHGVEPPLFSCACIDLRQGDLLREPKEKRDEVIVHELVHLKVGSHGPLFRTLARAYLQDEDPETRNANRSPSAC
jgi:hypothetical protein